MFGTKRAAVGEHEIKQGFNTVGTKAELKRQNGTPNLIGV
jgi:hypothetical protein